VLEGVLDFVYGLPDVADGLFRASLDPSRQFPVGDRSVSLLRLSPSGSCVPDLLEKCSRSFPCRGILSAAVKAAMDAWRRFSVVAEHGGTHDDHDHDYCAETDTVR
jgi:hypothetical protein